MTTRAAWFVLLLGATPQPALDVGGVVMPADAETVQSIDTGSGGSDTETAEAETEE